MHMHALAFHYAKHAKHAAHLRHVSFLVADGNGVEIEDISQTFWILQI